MALLDILRQKKQQLGAAPTQAGDISKLQQTAATGQAAAPTAGPAMSSIQSQLAAQQTQSTLDQTALGEAAAVQELGAAESRQQQQFDYKQDQQAKQLAEQRTALAQQFWAGDQERATTQDMTRAQLTSRAEQETQKTTQQFSNALRELAAARNITEQDIYAEVAKSQSALGLEKSKSVIEQLTHYAAMSDQDYLNQIKSIGAQRRLDDDLNFRKEAVRVAMGTDMQSLNRQFDFKRLLNMDSRAAKEELSKMDINTAIDLAKQASKEQAYTNMIVGTTEATRAGANYYAKTKAADTEGN